MFSEKEANPYATPQAVAPTALAGRPAATKLAKTGAWLQLLPLLGIIGTGLGMMRAFSTLTTHGAGDPAKLSAAIGEVLIATAVGFWGGMIGFVLLGFSLFVQRNQPRWVKVVFWLALIPALNGLLMLVLGVLSAIRGGS
ncbi:MAG: MotA/TolQ/ExbB proton channel family protein [Prosthecobacter sp.]